MSSPLHLILIIDSDPRTNPRTVEALRLGTGVGVWGRASVDFLLWGPALHLLECQSDSLPESDVIRRQWETIATWKRPVLVESAAQNLPAKLPEGLTIHRLSFKEQSDLLLKADRILYFGLSQTPTVRLESPDKLWTWFVPDKPSASLQSLLNASDMRLVSDKKTPIPLSWAEIQTTSRAAILA